MPVLSVIVSEEAYAILEKVSLVSGRDVEELAEAAVEEAALKALPYKGDRQGKLEL